MQVPFVMGFGAGLTGGGGGIVGGDGNILRAPFGHLAFMIAFKKNLGSTDLTQLLSKRKMPSRRGSVTLGMITCRVCWQSVAKTWAAIAHAGVHWPDGGAPPWQRTPLAPQQMRSTCWA